MKTALFFDTETSGLPLWKQPSEDPGQPHIVQLAGKVIDLDTRKCIHSLNTIVRPDGWEIGKDTSDIHGITQEYASDVGIKEEDALTLFLEFWDIVTNGRVAHGEPFDMRIIRIALKRYADDEYADIWKNGERQCTMRMATPICQLPTTGRGKYKFPKLAEAYRHFFDKEMENAHTAMGDVDACIAIYFAMMDMEHPMEVTV